MQAYEDRSFKFEVRPPPATWFIKRVAGVTKGAAMPGKETVGSVSLRSLYEIAVVKQQFDEAEGLKPLASVVRSLCGTARSMGLKLKR